MNRSLILFSLALVVFSSCSEARADSVAYANPGTVAPQSTLYALSSGDVYGYYAGNGSAGDSDSVSLYDVTTGGWSNVNDDSQTTAVGTMVNFGYVNQGDTLIVFLSDQTTGSTGASVGQDSSDGLNHAYMTDFGGGVLNGVLLPAGVYVGMEDRMQGQTYADFNYNDEDFVFTNVTQTPEPESLALLATGIVGGVGLLRRRVRR